MSFGWQWSRIRIQTPNSKLFVLNVRLDETLDYRPKPELTKWEQKIKEDVERKIFEQRRELKEYLEDEEKYA